MSTEIQRLENDLEDSFKVNFEGNLFGVLKRYISLISSESKFVVEKTSVDYFVQDKVNLVLAKEVGITIELPAVEYCYNPIEKIGKLLNIKKAVDEVGFVRILAQAGDTINGPTTNDQEKLITEFNDSLTLVATEFGWEVI